MMVHRRNSSVISSAITLARGALNLIDEFARADRGSDAFRFAHDTKGQPIELTMEHC
jgi:hypothetical protein